MKKYFSLISVTTTAKGETKTEFSIIKNRKLIHIKINKCKGSFPRPCKIGNF